MLSFSFLLSPLAPFSSSLHIFEASTSLAFIFYHFDLFTNRRCTFLHCTWAPVEFLLYLYRFRASSVPTVLPCFSLYGTLYLSFISSLTFQHSILYLSTCLYSPHFLYSLNTHLLSLTHHTYTFRFVLSFPHFSCKTLLNHYLSRYLASETKVFFVQLFILKRI